MKLGAILAFLVLARGALAFGSWMGLWGLNVQRFLSPVDAWLPWSLAALACVPALARKATPTLSRFGEALASRTGIVLVAAGAFGAALVWLLPDRVRWVGDSLIRLGGVRSDRAPEAISPQTLPLDAWIHYTLPQALVSWKWFDADGAVRWIGAMEAAVLAALACAFALAITTSGPARAAAAAVVFFGGYLCLLTGESKAFAEICLATVALAVLGVHVLRGGQGRKAAAAVIALGAVTAAGLAAHRLGLGLLPAFLLVWGAAWRERSARGTSRPALIASLALPVVALGLLGPRIWRTLATYDLPSNFLTADTASRGGLLASLLDATRLLDLASALLMLSPLALAIPFVWRREAQVRSRNQAAGSASKWDLEGTFLLVLAAPFLLAAFLARPPQGLIRDWDGLAGAGVSLSLLAAWGIAAVVARPKQAWLAVPATACAAAFTIQWLLHFHDLPRAAKRIEAFLMEPPARPAPERARAWDFLGWHYFQREDWDGASVAFDSASSLAPTPRMLSQWAMAETMRKNYAKARELYRQSVAGDPDYALGWTGVAVAAIWFEDLEDCERAAQHLRRLAPNDPKTLEILAYLATARGPSPPGSP